MRRVVFSGLVVLGLTPGLGGWAAVQVIGVQYQPDQMFPEFDCYWNASAFPNGCATNRPGATVHAYLKNTGASAVTLDDATLAGHSLKTIIKRAGAGWNADLKMNSIYFHWDNPPQDVLDAGEPVWYRFDPPTVPAGGVAQVAVRLRYVPANWIRLGVVNSAGTVTTNITVDANAPRVASIGYSEDLKQVYIHWRRGGGGVPPASAAPASVWLDGTNVTSLTTTVGDPNLSFASSVISLNDALPFFSYHVFQGVYSDGKIASASQRAWTNKFIYASFGNFPTDANYTVADWVEEASDHGLNSIQHNLGDMAGYMATAAGRADCRARGYGYTLLDPGNLNALDPDMWFLYDEPDVPEAIQSPNVCGTGTRLPCDGEHWAGTLAMREIEHGHELRALRPNVPTLINLDGGLQPESFYIWGQAVDILQSDNYYEVRLRDSYWFYPNRIPLFKNAKVSYAVSRTASAAAEPNPFNHLLYSVKWRCGNVNNCGVHYDELWPYPFPASKRIEAYYSLAGGAKGMGYWWFKGGNPSFGLVKTAECAALWKEMGLVGNEIKTARNLIVKSIPVDLPLTPSTNVWARAMASGTDTLILYVVNDNYYNDQAGCHVTDVPNATVTLTLPLWMQNAPIAFEVTAGGLRDVNTQRSGNQLQVNLGVLKLTRMIILTADGQLRTMMQQRYDQSVRPGVCKFAPEYCTNSPPSITQQPVNRSIAAGATTSFTVVASGSGTLSHRWQKNGDYLGNGGHYSGAISGTLTIAGADANDMASYRCVVTNAYGSVTSSIATLTVTNAMSPPDISQHPSNRGVLVGGTASFTIAAVGTGPLGYRWQYSVEPQAQPYTNLDDGGHYSGVTAPGLVISNADSSDAGSYRCVVTNVYGSTTSSAAGLTLITNVPCWEVMNGGFEGGFGLAGGGYVSSNWTEWEAESDVVIGYDETGITHGGGHAQRIRVWGGTGGTSGGVSQRVPVVAGEPFNIGVWTYAGDSVSACSLGVDPAGGRDPANGVIWSSANTNAAWVQKTVSGFATADFITVFLKVASSDNVKRNGFFDNAGSPHCMETPPSITTQPANQSVVAGGTANFTIVAEGSDPLSYQWQKNNADLANSGHYSGSTTPTLTITSVDAGDAASYRCVVTNAFGSTNSAAATLMLITPNFCIGTLNADFENGFSLAGGGYTADNWTEWEAEPDVVIGYDETDITHGGGHSQRIRVWGGDSGGSGGVYQRVPVTAGQSYAVSVWASAGDGLTTCYLGVDRAGGTNSTSGVAWSSGTSNVGWFQQSWAGTAAGNHLTIYLKVQSSDGSKRNGYFDDVSSGGLNGPLHLMVHRDGDLLTLTWPVCPAARLEWTAALGAAATWNTVTNPASATGGQKSVSLSTTGNAGYYRLVLE